MSIFVCQSSAWAAVLMTALLWGCASQPDHDSAPHTEDPTMQITLLGFPSCPMTPDLRSNARAALTLIPGRWELVEVDQETLEPGDIRRGWPAPTLLVNGRDLFGMPAPVGPSMGCRVYDGGVPSPERIAERLRTMNSEHNTSE